MNTAQSIQPTFTDAGGLVSLGLYKSKDAVFSAVKRKSIPCYKHGRRILFKIEEITAPIESARRPTAEEEERQAATHVLLQSVERY